MTQRALSILSVDLPNSHKEKNLPVSEREPEEAASSQVRVQCLLRNLKGRVGDTGDRAAGLAGQQGCRAAGQ